MRRYPWLTAYCRPYPYENADHTNCPGVWDRPGVWEGRSCDCPCHAVPGGDA